MGTLDGANNPTIFTHGVPGRVFRVSKNNFLPKVSRFLIFEINPPHLEESVPPLLLKQL